MRACLVSLLTPVILFPAGGMGRREDVSARAHKGWRRGGQVGDLKMIRQIFSPAALRAGRALADTPPAPDRLLGKVLKRDSARADR